MTKTSVYIVGAIVFFAAGSCGPVTGETPDQDETPLGARLAGLTEVVGEPYEAVPLEPAEAPEDEGAAEGWFRFRCFGVTAALPGPGVELKARSDHQTQWYSTVAVTKKASTIIYVGADYESVFEDQLGAMTSLPVHDALAEELVEGGMAVSEALQAIRKAQLFLQVRTDRKLFEAIISASTQDLRQETEVDKALRTAILIYLRRYIPSATRAVRHDMVRYQTYVLWDPKRSGALAYTFALGGNMVCAASLSVFERDRISDIAPVFATTLDPEPLLRKHYPELFAAERRAPSDRLPEAETEFSGPEEP
jgi:hypothetical protein